MTRGLPTLAAALAVVAGACVAPSDGPSRMEAENEIAARTLLGMWGSGDAMGVAGLFHPEAVYDDFANQEQYRGLQEIASYLSNGTRWATGVNMSVTAVHASDNGAVAEWVFSGFQERPIGALFPDVTGREVVLNGVTILEIDQGRIRRAADYMDVLPLVLQLGAEVRMPGGSTLKVDPSTPEDIP